MRRSVLSRSGALFLLLCCLSANLAAEVRSLAGEWRFRPGDDPAWAAPDFDDSDWQTASVPGYWPKGGFPEADQLGWYRLRVPVDPDDAPLSVRFGGVRYAFELYADGMRLGGAGTLPPDASMEFDRQRILPIPANALADGEVVLAVRVWGGFPAAVAAAGAGPYAVRPLIGDSADLMRDLLISELPIALLAFVFAIAALWFFYFFYRVPRLKTYLWFSLTAIVIAPYMLTQTQLKYTLGWPFEIIEKIETITFGVLLVLLAQFFYAAMERPIDRWMRIWQVGYLSLGLVFLFSPGLEMLFMLRPAWQAVSVLVGLPFLGVVLLELRRGNPGARWVSIGAVVFTVFALSDMLLVRGNRGGPPLIPLGFLFVLGMLGVLMINRFAALLDRLESEVSERTRALETTNTQLQAVNEALQEQSIRDPLTGLLNRRGLEASVREEMARIARGGPPYALLLFDADRFKSLNDEYGHAGGDVALAGIGEVLGNELRAVDRQARWGGEEFLVLLHDADAEQAVEVGEKLRRSIAGLGLQHEGQTLPLTVTIGIAALRPDETFESCLARADAALYEGKEAGRDRAVLAP